MNKYNNEHCLLTSISNGISEYADNRSRNVTIPLHFVIRRHVCEFISNRFIGYCDHANHEYFDSMLKLLDDIIR